MRHTWIKCAAVVYKVMCISCVKQLYRPYCIQCNQMYYTDLTLNITSFKLPTLLSLLLTHRQFY